MARTYDTNTTADEITADLSQDIKGKVILTTGVTLGGLGAAFMESIAKAQPGLLILASRNLEKLQMASDKIASVYPNTKAKLLELDLSSFAAVRRAASTLISWTDVTHVDVLVNNAALMAVPYQLTADGFESQFGTNHLGHFLFTNLIMPKILASKSPRIVNVTSTGHRLNPIRWCDYNFDKGKTYNKWLAYGQSKTANMLMALSLADKLGPKYGVLAFCLHPGTVEGTDIASSCDWTIDYPELQSLDKMLGNPEGWETSFPWKSQQRGTATYVYAAFDPNLRDHNGAYLLDSHIGNPLVDTIRPWATSKAEADRLWELSEELVGQKFAY